MLQSDVQERLSVVRDTREVLSQLVGILSEYSGGSDTIDELCERRHYHDERMINLLKSKQIFLMPSLSDIQILAQASGLNLTPQMLRSTGLVGDNGEFWLQDRYAIPLRNYSGDVMALVCWFPDKRKYITTGTLGFSSTTTFFNQDSWKRARLQNSGQTVAFVVEGIFDALSIESLGYCAFGNQGLALSPVKKEMLSRFDRVYFIPDNDNPGSKSNKYLCKKSSHLWDTPNGHLIQLSGGVKDMDDLIKKYQPASLDDWITSNRLLRIQT